MLIYGNVADANTGLAIPGATVSVLAKQISAATDNVGYFEINNDNLTSDDTVTFSGAEYLPITANAGDIYDGDSVYPTGATYLMTQTVVTLPGITITTPAKTTLTPPATTTSGILPIAIIGLGLLALSGKKKKKISGTAGTITEWLPLIAIGAGIIIFWKPISALFKTANTIANTAAAIISAPGQIITALNSATDTGIIQNIHDTVYQSLYDMVTTTNYDPTLLANFNLVTQGKDGNGNPLFTSTEISTLLNLWQTPKASAATTAGNTAAQTAIDLFQGN